MDNNTPNIESTVEDIEKKINFGKSLMELAKKKPIQAIIGAIMFIGPSTTLGWIATTWHDVVNDAVVIGLKDEKSKIHKTNDSIIKAETIHVADSVFEVRIHESMEDPALWATVLSNAFILEMKTETKKEVFDEFDKELARRDSSNNWMKIAAKQAGIRDEDAQKWFIKMFIDFIEEKSIRVVPRVRI